VTIDGENFQDADLAPLKPESEIYLIPRSAAADRRAAWATTPGGAVNRRPVASRALPLIDGFGPLFARVGYRIVSK
jgi:hypothetical protein